MYQIVCDRCGEVFGGTDTCSSLFRDKDILMSRENPHIDYINQILIIHPDGRADSWTASSSDIFADDWEIVMEE